MDQAAQIRVVFPPPTEEFDPRLQNERIQAAIAFIHFAACGAVSIDGKVGRACGSERQSKSELIELDFLKNKIRAGRFIEDSEGLVVNHD